MPWIRAFHLPNSLACEHAVSATKRLYLLTDIRISAAAVPHTPCTEMQTFAHVVRKVLQSSSASVTCLLVLNRYSLLINDYRESVDHHGVEQAFRPASKARKYFGFSR
jgi:hypothetical protein